jgi:hypothetical protein
MEARSYEDTNTEGLGDRIKVMAPLMMGISENKASLYVRYNHHGSSIKVTHDTFRYLY